MDKLFTELNFLLGRPEAAFDYPLQGWSYYNRATNLLREPARAEVGWGQWTKPGSDDDDQFNEVCALNPLGFLECDDTDNNSETNNNDPNCMGDYLQRESCDVWVCGDEDKGGIRGSIEGGMGVRILIIFLLFVSYNSYCPFHSAVILVELTSFLFVSSFRISYKIRIGRKTSVHNTNK